MASPANVLDFPPNPPSEDLLAEILRRRTERLAGQSKAYARTIPIASDVDPDSCARRQVLEIVAWQDKPVPEADRQARFEAGNRAEEDIIIDLKRDGFRVVQEQVPFELKHRKTGEPCLRGKIDGKIQWNGQMVPFEVKSANPLVFQRITTVADFEHFWWTRGRYGSQLQAYLIGHGHEWGFWILTDCLGNWKLLRLDLDYALAERIWAFAESILDGVRVYRFDGTLPGFTADPTQCAHCDFFGRTCNPDTIEQGARMLADPELEVQLARWSELREPAKEYGSIDKRVKETLRKALPGPDARGIVGRFAIQITERAVKGFEVKPRTDRIVEIAELMAGGAR